jgi:glycosyltransferase involved in cell wall biosynthesis
MRRIALDVTRLVGRALKGRLPTGIDRVGLAYVDHYRARAQAVVRVADRPLLAGAEASDRLFAQLLTGPVATARERLRLLEATSRLVPERVRPDEFVLVHTGHGGLERPDFLRRWSRAGGHALTFVHDLIPITHPEFARAGEAEKHEARMRAALSCSSAIVVNSAATERELRSFAKAKDLAVPAVAVAHLGVSALPDPAPLRPIAEPYFVVLGTIEARKNHWLLVQLWRRLVEMHGERAPKLVIIGQRGWECEHVFAALDRCTPLKNAVLERGDLRDAELATYLHHARALLFPSFVEGYGLPLVEGLAAGLPVVASPLPVFRELAGDAPTYIDPLDGAAWLTAVEDLARRTPTEARGRLGFTAPSWSDHFAVIDETLARLG